MLAAAARRFAVLLALGSLLTLVGALLFAAIAGTPVRRALSVGFYLVGSFVLLLGFFIGNRGPARVRGESGGWPFPFSGGRRLRWATAEEADEAINTSAVFVTLGLALLLVGVAVDGRHDVV